MPTQNFPSITVHLIYRRKQKMNGQKPNIDRMVRVTAVGRKPEARDLVAALYQFNVHLAHPIFLINGREIRPNTWLRNSTTVEIKTRK